MEIIQLLEENPSKPASFSFSNILLLFKKSVYTEDFLYYYLAHHSSVRPWIKICIRTEIFSLIRIRFFYMRIWNTALYNRIRTVQWNPELDLEAYQIEKWDLDPEKIDLDL